MAERDPNWSERRRNYPAYERDYAAWVDAQIGLLRAGDFDALDLENLLDEVEGLARSDFRAFVSAIRIVLVHMLKWDVQVDFRSRSWASSIEEHRRRVVRALEDSPSYRNRLDQAIERAFERARYDASIETGLPLETFPEASPFTFDDIIKRQHARDVF